MEGGTPDPQILGLRARQQRNLLTTLLLSQGVPMIAHGDAPDGSTGDLAWFLPDGNRMQDSDWRWEADDSVHLEARSTLVLIRP